MHKETTMSAIRSKDRASLCLFSFADNRRCRLPRSPAHPYLFKTKAASTLGYLAQTLLQAIHLAQHEYINAFGTDSWRRTIRNSFAEPSPPTLPPIIDPEPESQGPAPTSSSPVAYKPEPSRPTSTPLQPMTPRAAVLPPSATPPINVPKPVPRNATSYLESTLAKLYQNKQL
jgi:hypothetical protein